MQTAGRAHHGQVSGAARLVIPSSQYAYMYSAALPAVAHHGAGHAVCLPHRGTGQHYGHGSRSSTAEAHQYMDCACVKRKVAASMVRLSGTASTLSYMHHGNGQATIHVIVSMSAQQAHWVTQGVGAVLYVAGMPIIPGSACPSRAWSKSTWKSSARFSHKNQSASTDFA